MNMQKRLNKNGRGGTRTGAGRKPAPQDQRMRRRSIGMLESDWQKAREIAESAGVSVDEVMRRLIRAQASN